MILKCIIVDDEPLSQEILKDYCESCPELSLVATCNDAIEAGMVLSEKQVDLIFLDINMPKLSGISFVKTLKTVPLVIFVTAYPEYAIEGFEIDALDYLLKPVAFERFRMAVTRAIERFSLVEEKDREFIMVRADKKDYRLAFDEIIYLEARGDYVRFITESQNLMVHSTMKEIIAQLPETKFVRIHKTYVVALAKVVFVEGNSVNIGKAKLPVSLSFKEAFLAKLNV